MMLVNWQLWECGYVGEDLFVAVGIMSVLKIICFENNIDYTSCMPHGVEVGPSILSRSMRRDYCGGGDFVETSAELAVPCSLSSALNMWGWDLLCLVHQSRQMHLGLR